MYKKEKLRINIFYNDKGIEILDVLKSDFKDFLNDYLRKKVL